jgi:hypothetical protein
MKSKASLFTVVMIAVVVALLIFPSPGMARGYRSHGHGHGDLGWVGPAAIIAGGLLLGTAIISSTQRAPVYAYPTPPSQGYTYTDPSYYPPQISSGQWVMVPGQWVNDNWVPQHEVWVQSTP